MSIKIKNAPRNALLALSLIGAAACSGGSTTSADAGLDSGPPPPQSTYIALLSDLQGYQSWAHYDAGNEVVDQIHNNGFRTVYIGCTAQPGFNCQLPAHGRPTTAFDIGTMIVKEVPVTDGGTPEIFAMSKRGGDFNDAGAVAWEWFALDDGGTNGDLRILWRGDGPPQGSTYGASHEACNECHALSVDNDFVSSPPLQFVDGGGIAGQGY